MNPQNEKTIIMVSMGITGYHVLSGAFANLPALPSILTNPLVGGISMLTVAAAGTLYGIYVLLTKY